MDRFVFRASKLLLGICTAAVLLIVIVFQFLSYKRKLDFLLPNYALVLLLLLLLLLFLVWDRSTAAARCRSRTARRGISEQKQKKILRRRVYGGVN